ncbi:MAG TPA: hypothetical protein VNF99_13980 [Stellaceae bacterium]|nr:hypothetical protein [Stellaceae bacterium]
MTRGKILAASLAVAGALTVGLGAGSSPASAQGYGCMRGYYYANGYCYPYAAPPPPVTYYPPTYYDPPPVVVGPSFGINFGFGDDDWHGGDRDGGFHGGDRGDHGDHGGRH